MTKQHSAQPVEGDRRDFTFTATGGASITVTATYAATWRDELEPCIGVDEVCAILDAWTGADAHYRQYLWPSTERSDDDVFIAYIWEGRVVLDTWTVATDRDQFSLKALPDLLADDHYTFAEAPNTQENGR